MDASSNVVFAWAIKEPPADIFAIPNPPAPFRPSAAGRMSWSRRLIMRLSNLVAWITLGAILAAVGLAL
jgi:hypothetical protein